MLLSVTVGLALSSPGLLAQTTDSAWRYRLLGESSLTDDCPVCGRPTIPQPARGTFDLLLTSESGTTARYAVSGIRIRSALFSGEEIEITGEGELVVDRLSGQATMELRIRSSHDTNAYTFIKDVAVPEVARLWPVFEVSLIETQAATAFQTFHLHLLAAPLRELWFSTVNGMTRGIPGPELERVAADDFLSDSGLVLRLGTNLLEGAGLPRDPSDHRVDAVQPGSGGEMFFSLTQSETSSSLGPVQPGDLISDRGRSITGYADLLREFSVMPPVPDLGLDAVQVRPDGEILFSTIESAFSEALGINLGSGDLLSSQGRRVRSAKELAGAFKPADPDQDPGLDAFYMWPSGEIWFSTETGFNWAQGLIAPGDLLSDQGYVVFRNLELLRAFGPLEDLADFGLDALWIVSDTASNASQPTLTIHLEDDPPRLRIDAEGLGAAFQLEKAADPAGPFIPWGPILPEIRWYDTWNGGPTGRAYYRLRQW